MRLCQEYLQPQSLAEALALLRQHAGGARIVAGGTDLVIEAQRGIRTTNTLIDISAVRELRYVYEQGGCIHLGGLATHNDVLASPDCRALAVALVQACLEVGAPQIRTRATIAGNLVTASPANDTIAPLMAMDGDLVLVSSRGERTVPLSQFYPGFRRTALQPDELVREIRFAGLTPDQRGLFQKLGLRRAQAISVINVAMIVTLEGETVRRARVTLGCLAPTIVHAVSAEEYLEGKQLSAAVCAEAGRLACADASPIDDLRGSAGYRNATLQSLVSHGLWRIAEGRHADGLPEAPILLDSGYRHEHDRPFAGEIYTTVNGRPVALSGAVGKTLLAALREDAGLTGTKEGCAEGECGACTVWLDGHAVMACLVPAPQAHNAVVTTIEGLAGANRLHPLQQAFVDHGAVQCGYCIPGMLMAGAKLLHERPHPSLDETQVALSGNICRCTGYRKILDAVAAAAETSA